MNLKRLYQPGNPKFWLAIFLNGLSSVISYILQTRDPPAWAFIVLVVFALANFLIGVGIALQLMRYPPESSGADTSN